MKNEAVLTIVEKQLSDKVSEDITAMAEHIVSQSAEDGAVRSVMLYGSGLWQKQASDDCIYDFQVLVESYSAYKKSILLSALGSVLPPNVYYAEAEHQGRTLRFKYNVMREDQFIKAARGKCFTPAIWARFAQPSRLVFSADNAANHSVHSAIASCLKTFFDRTSRLQFEGNETDDYKSFWGAGLSSTYQDEMRSEAKNRPQLIVEAAPGYYRQVYDALSPCIHKYAVSRKILRPLRKAVALCRVIKGALTFENGVDYALWKVERHSGIKESATPFQKKYPLIAGWPLLWRLYRKGAFR
jgi:hypothetical protein